MFTQCIPLLLRDFPYLPAKILPAPKIQCVKGPHFLIAYPNVQMDHVLTARESNKQYGHPLSRLNYSNRVFPQFFNDIRNKFDAPHLHLVHGSATDITQILHNLKLPKADYILSSLPLSNFPAALRQTILEEIKQNLNANGKLIQFQYTRGLRKLYGAHFKHVQIDYTALNFPPAFIYTCKNS